MGAEYLQHYEEHLYLMHQREAETGMTWELYDEKLYQYIHKTFGHIIHNFQLEIEWIEDV